jgi:SAM-dependent methyltransferase
MTLTQNDWHERFLQQAGWTEPLRTHLFARFDLGDADRILEIGCGTGAVSAAVTRKFPAARSVGLDFDIPRLGFARAHDPSGAYAGGDALRLPFPGGVFDLTYCHYFLLWVREPGRAVREMIRVTRRGGWVAALAEPDYGGRIDHPAGLAKLGRLQSDSLRAQGADPEFGRKLAGLLSECGIRVETSGVLGAELSPGLEGSAGSEMELKILREDLGDKLSNSDWETIASDDRAARESGRRVLFVPTFYAAGRV